MLKNTVFNVFIYLVYAYWLLLPIFIPSLPWISTYFYTELDNQDEDKTNNQKQRPNCELLPSEPLPFSPSKVGEPSSSTNLKTGNSRINSQRDSLYPNPPSPEGIDVRSYNSQRPSLAAEVVHIIFPCSTLM